MTDLLAARSRLHGKRVALIQAESGKEWSYGELDRRANVLAAGLLARGLRPGDRVAAVLRNRVECLDLLFAALRLGASFAPLNYRLSAIELAHQLQVVKPSVVMTERDFGSLIPDSRAGKLDIEDAGFPELHASMETAEVKRPADDEGPWLLLFTGGTTGAPKAAVLSVRMVNANAINTVLGWELSSRDTGLLLFPMFHTGGFNVLLLPLIACGARGVMLRQFHADLAVRAISEHKVSVLVGVPAMLQAMAGAPSFADADLSSLRLVKSGGGALPRPVFDQWKKKRVVVAPGYGLTEFGPNNFALDPDDAERKWGSVGVPMPLTETRLEGSAPDAGELLLRGPCACSGYWENPKATADIFRDGWVRTGDVFHRDADGFFYFRGRMKEMWKSGGENVYATEVEDAILSHPAVSEAVAFGVPDPKWGEVGKAVVVLRTGAYATKDEILASAKERLAKYKLPKYLVFVSGIPRSEAGKPLRARVKQEHGKAGD